MRIIQKRELKMVSEGPFGMGLHAGSAILTTQMRNGVLIIWVLCDPEKAIVGRNFVIYSTGSYVPDNPGMYVATLQIGKTGEGHLFEVMS